MIGPSWVFNVYSRLNGDTNFQAGTYELRKNMGVNSAVKTMKKGPHINYVKLTIPPGFWLKQVAARVGNLPGLTVDPFVEATQNNAVRSAFEPAGTNNLEGLIWPDTYDISADEDEISVLSTLVTNFDKQAVTLGLANADVQGYSAYDIMKVASLVEAEAKVDHDRPLIASVIYNRLARGMPLQIDATLIYARGDPHNRALSDKDKLIESPYNTYMHTGLPPTPIAIGERGVVEGRARARGNARTCTTSSSTRRATPRSRARCSSRTRTSRSPRRTGRFDDSGAPISGATRVAGVIGDPVRHSLSPVLHNAAYRALGLDWVYVAFEVPDGATRGALDAMRALGFGRSVGHDAAQDRSRYRLRRAVAGRGRAAQREHDLDRSNAAAWSAIRPTARGSCARCATPVTTRPARQWLCSVRAARPAPSPGRSVRPGPRSSCAPASPTPRPSPRAWPGARARRGRTGPAPPPRPCSS